MEIIISTQRFSDIKGNGTGNEQQLVGHCGWVSLIGNSSPWLMSDGSAFQDFFQHLERFIFFSKNNTKGSRANFLGEGTRAPIIGQNYM